MNKIIHLYTRNLIQNIEEKLVNQINRKVILVVAIAFTALASIYSIYRYFKIRKASLPIVIDQTSTGNDFLISQIVELQKSGDKREEDYISFAIIHTRCKEKNNYNLRDLFPKHRLTASDIHQCSIEQLLNLKGRDFFAIIDLISGKQAMQILTNKP